MSKSLLNLLLIVASFAVYYLIIGPVYSGVGGVWQPADNVASLKSLSKQYDETLTQAQTLSSQADTLRAEYARVTDEQKAAMQIMVPDSIDKVRLLSEVHSIIQQSGFAPQELAYSEGSAASNGRGSAAVSFSVKTTYPQFKRLMDNFEKSKRLFSIQNVTFVTPTNPGEFITYQVKLETYYLK